MGKYFASDLEAKEWAAAKFQALFRGREHRRMVERKRLEMLEALSLLVDCCNVRILREREAVDGYEGHVVRVASRRFVEDAGDGKLAALQHSMKGKPESVDMLYRGYRNERAAHRAAENGHSDCLRLCINTGHDVDDQTTLGNTAAHYAAMGGANDCIRLLSDELADIMMGNNVDQTPINICAARGKESTMDLIKALAVDGEDLVMRRRRANEVVRQEEMRRKKGILYGRDLDGGEGGNEFIVPTHAHLNDESKYHVSCGLRARGTIDNVISASRGTAEPQIIKRKKERAERDKGREGVRAFGFMKRNRGASEVSAG
jgi:hypothetical protein